VYLLKSVLHSWGDEHWKGQGSLWLRWIGGAAARLPHWRTMMNVTSTTSLPREPWNKGKLIGQKGPAQAEGHLGGAVCCRSWYQYPQS
jgi:hypothetical protein